MGLRRSLLVVAAAVTALGASAVASADNIQIEGSGDRTVEPGSSVVIAWRIHETSGDCNVEPGAPVVVTVTPSGPVSASASTLTFTTCGSSQGVTFTVAADATPGDYPVTVSVNDATIGGDGTATIHVPEPPLPPDTTKPVVTPPANQTLEATSAAGRTQALSGTAIDDRDGSLPAPCLPSSYPLGSTTVTCTATDAAGNSGSADFIVTVQDTTAPVLSLPAPITTAATSAAGATVSFTVTANDLVAGAVPVSCDHGSGSTFPLGVTTVTCSATDGTNPSSSGSFSVTVTNSAPTITVPGQQTVEASNALGSNVNFVPAPTASDPQEGVLVPSCSHASGSRFPIGTTTVTCTATDGGGASATASFDVVVRDTTPPVVIPPLDTVVATDTSLSSADPRIARFIAAASAADLVGVVRVESNVPAFLPLGVSSITFTATDAAGNVGAASATIELRLPVAGQPAPPAAPPVVRVPPANVAGLRARPLAGAVQLEWRAVANASRYVVTRSDRAGVSTLAFDGRATTFVDRGLVDGEEYRYVVVTYDAAGLRSVGVAVVAVPAQPVLSAPRHGAAVSRPPLLTWRRVPGATYYNAQLLRIAADGSGTKVLSVWPVKNRFQLGRTWRYAGKTQRLAAGTYEWFVWAGLGSRAAQKYSPLLGWSRFTVRPATR
jgi:HYR domain